MRPVAALLATLLGVATAPPAFGQSESYEANPGLIPTSGFVVFFNAGGPLSYATLTAKDLPAHAVRLGVVKGRGCQFGVSTPLIGFSAAPQLSAAAGEGGYEKALQDIRAKHPDLKGIYDVRVDDHLVSVLTVFQRQCMEVTAKGFE